MRSLLTLVSFGMLLAVAKASDSKTIHCNATSKCPQDVPCCNQYGVCGVGGACLGGCHPGHSFNLTACMPQPRMSSFQGQTPDASKLAKYESYLGNASSTDWVYTGYVSNADNALLLQMPKNSVGTVLSSTKYFWYGRVGATIKSSRDVGVVTSFITFSDPQDEIDYEFVHDLTHPQSNYYSLGILNYTNSVNLTTSDTFKNWHYYEIDWKQDQTDWIIDGKVMRTLKRSDTWNSTTKRYDYPATPARVQFSLWPAGSELNAIGTIQWAGGAINWDSQDIQRHGYYYAYVKNISVQVYDLPSSLSHIKNGTAFLYNSTTDFKESNVLSTNKKTWLGNSKAVGFNPQNEDNLQTLLLLMSSASKNATSVSKPTAGANGSSVTDFATPSFANEFNQGASSKSKGASGSGSSSKSGGGAGRVDGAIGALMGLVAGFLML